MSVSAEKNMDAIEIVIQIIGGLLAVLGEAFLTNLFPNGNCESKLQRKERLNGEAAAKHRIVSHTGIEPARFWRRNAW